MGSAQPLVSVMLVTYNHAQYIAEAIRSVLDQTCADLELVIVDDGSTDATPDVIASFQDPRIVSIRQPNQGPSAATNRALAAARGRFVATMSGDDVCCPDRLRQQLARYGQGPRRLLFSAVDFIDEESKPLSGSHYAARLFDVAPLTRAQILERFFFHGNFINSVTCFTERDVFLQEPPYDPLLYKLQDYDMWIRMVKKYALSFQSEITVHYRIRAGGMNLSAPTPGHLVRYSNEFYLILRRFFDGMPPDLFREAFAAHLRRPTCGSLEEIACEQALLYLASHAPLSRLIGIERLRDLLENPDTAAVLERLYAFTCASFVELLQHVDVCGVLAEPQTTLYVDTGAGFSEQEAHRQLIDYAASQFCVTFDLSDTQTVRGLRWDPVELRFCRVRLDNIRCQDRTGKETLIEPMEAVSNGYRHPDGYHDFETLDPIFLLPVQGEMTTVTICGTWDVEGYTASILGVGTRLEEKNRQLQWCREQLRVLPSLRRWGTTALLALRSACSWVRQKYPSGGGRRP